MMRRDMEDILKGRPDTRNHDYKNPALFLVDGVLTSCCVMCGVKIDDEYSTQNWFKFIRQEYCTDCKAKVEREQNLSRQKRYRRNRKEETKCIRQQNGLLKQENKLLREMVMALRDDVEQLKSGGL